MSLEVSNEKVYHINAENGEVKEVKGGTQYEYVVSVYNNDDDLNVLEGTTPLSYSDFTSLKNDLLLSDHGITDIDSWLNDEDSTIVIRRIKVAI